MFLETNDLPGTTVCILWETAKEVMPSRIISHWSYETKRGNSMGIHIEQSEKVKN